MKYSENFKAKKDLILKKTVSVGFDGFVDYLIQQVDKLKFMTKIIQMKMLEQASVF